MASTTEQEIVRLQQLLGLPQAELVVKGLEATLGYFREVLHTDPFLYRDYLRGIDFHQPVTREFLQPGTPLSRHIPPNSREKPFVYFTKPGTSPISTGTSFPESTFELFEVPYRMEALVSRASGLQFSPTDRVSRLGGGIQYILSSQDAKQLRCK